jgi:hypothetical protein
MHTRFSTEIIAHGAHLARFCSTPLTQVFEKNCIYGGVVTEVPVRQFNLCSKIKMKTAQIVAISNVGSMSSQRVSELLLDFGCAERNSSYR